MEESVILNVMKMKSHKPQCANDLDEINLGLNKSLFFLEHNSIT